MASRLESARDHIVIFALTEFTLVPLLRTSRSAFCWSQVVTAPAWFKSLASAVQKGLSEVHPHLILQTHPHSYLVFSQLPSSFPISGFEIPQNRPVSPSIVANMAENGTTLPTNPSTEETSFAENKGKGKAAAEDVPHTGDAAMDEDDDEDDDDDDDDDDDEEEVFALFA